MIEKEAQAKKSEERVKFAEPRERRRAGSKRGEEIHNNKRDSFLYVPTLLDREKLGGKKEDFLESGVVQIGAIFMLRIPCTEPNVPFPDNIDRNQDAVLGLDENQYCRNSKKRDESLLCLTKVSDQENLSSLLEDLENTVQGEEVVL